MIFQGKIIFALFILQSVAYHLLFLQILVLNLQYMMNFALKKENFILKILKKVKMD